MNSAVNDSNNEIIYIYMYIITRFIVGGEGVDQLNSYNSFVFSNGVSVSEFITWIRVAFWGWIDELFQECEILRGDDDVWTRRVNMSKSGKCWFWTAFGRVMFKIPESISYLASSDPSSKSSKGNSSLRK